MSDYLLIRNKMNKPEYYKNFLKRILSISIKSLRKIPAILIVPGVMLLSSELATFLSGRYIEFKVYSLTYAENFWSFIN